MSEVVKEFCPKCKAETFQQQIIKPKGPHYGEQFCIVCEGHIKFLPKPKNIGARRANKYLPRDLGIYHCQMCMRDKDNLVNYETLESHHVVQIIDGGNDIPANIWVVCSTCHKTIHFNRRYLRRKDGIYPTVTGKE